MILPAVEGVSLTIIECDASSFTVSLVTYTRQNTTLGARRPGDPVNLEVDIIARYLERMLNVGSDKGPNSGQISKEFLAQNGFIK